MACRRALPILAAAALGAALGCSKTQDTAADPMRFGQPPVIEKVNFSVAEKTVECDLTKAVDAFLYNDGPFDNVCGKDAAGNDCSRSVRLATYRLDPAITQIVGGTYTEMRIEATVNDPDSTLAQDNVLLATASFVLNSGTSGATEYSLIVLDDGSKNQFDYTQKGGIKQANCGNVCETPPPTTTCEDILDFSTFPPTCPAEGMWKKCDGDVPVSQETCQDCCSTCPFDSESFDCTTCLKCTTVPSEPICEPVCDIATYTLNTNDATEGDHVFSRGFAFFNLALGGTFANLLGDCIAQQQHQAPFTPQGAQRLEFRIEAVDRQGNLAEWGEKPTADISTNTFTCTGDECICCFFRNAASGGFLSDTCQDPEKTPPGPVDPESDPNGKCRAPNPTAMNPFGPPSACPMKCPGEP